MSQVENGTDGTGDTTPSERETGPGDIADQREASADDDDGDEDPSMTLSEAEDQVEVYHTDNDLAAGQVIDELLAPEGIRALTHDRRSHAIFAPASLPGEIGIAVPGRQAEQARQVLRQARVDGVLTDDGEIIEDETATA